MGPWNHLALTVRAGSCMGCRIWSNSRPGFIGLAGAVFSQERHNRASQAPTPAVLKSLDGSLLCRPLVFPR